MSVYCQSQGGAVYGKVFHDKNLDGIYQPQFGETGFNSSELQLHLVDCNPSSISCDWYNYSSPWYDVFRTFPISQPGTEENGDSNHCPDAENGGCFEFVCPDCYGSYKLVLSSTIDPEEHGWSTSLFQVGDYREGWTEISTSPNVTDNVHNNFVNFESTCFDMYSNMSSLEPFEVVLDLGISLQEDNENIMGVLAKNRGRDSYTEGLQNYLNEVDLLDHLDNYVGDIELPIAFRNRERSHNY